MADEQQAPPPPDDEGGAAESADDVAGGDQRPRQEGAPVPGPDAADLPDAARRPTRPERGE
jgi:hypothetical protein